MFIHLERQPNSRSVSPSPECRSDSIYGGGKVKAARQA
jgi:hypothetical protein